MTNVHYKAVVLFTIAEEKKFMFEMYILGKSLTKIQFKFYRSEYSIVFFFLQKFNYDQQLSKNPLFVQLKSKTFKKVI